MVNTRVDEKYHAEFHLDPNLYESDMNTCPLTGNLKMFLLKYMSNYININSIKSEEIKDIMIELKNSIKVVENPQKDIQSNLSDKSGSNIIGYNNYVCSIIDDKELDKLMKLIDKNKQNEIIKYWSVLSKYEPFNKLFEIELNKALEKSYFDYSLIALSLHQQKDRKEYLSEKNNCDNVETRFLFHGTQIDPVSLILTGGFLYTRKAFYGMGIYFTDMLDYSAFYAGGHDLDSRRDNFGEVLPVNETFSCVATEIYYEKFKKKDIYDFSLLVDELDHFPTYNEIKKNYKDKMVEKNGVHFARVEGEGGQVRNKQEIIKDSKEGKFIGTEYVITEMSQILPLYGLTFKRNEYFVIWRDPHFEGENEYSDYLRERKLFIYKEAKMNAYFESSTEKALEIIKRKQYNKIILISSIGLDYSGRKFVEVARQILGFNVVVLFFSSNEDHLKWIKDFPNALYTNEASFYKDYIINYNEKGLLDLKKNIEKSYNIKLKFTDDYFKFPKFINNDQYHTITFGAKTPNFRKVIIKNAQTNSILCMDSNRNVSFKSSYKLDVNNYQWYVTIINNKITLFSNGSYLGANPEMGIATAEKFMQRYLIEEIKSNSNNKEYLIYFGDKSNVLTVNGENVIIENEHSDRTNQKFKLIEELDI